MTSDHTKWDWFCWILFVAAFLAICTSAAQPATSETKIDWRAEAYLRDDPDQFVVVALVAKPGRAEALAHALGLQSYGVFHYIDTVIARVAAERLIEWQGRDDILLMDPIDNSIAKNVTDLLTELYRVVLYDDLGSFRPAVLNLSLGVPRQLIGKGLSGDRVVHRAIEQIVEQHGIPVIMSAGNDGPEPGLVNPWALASGVFVVGAADEKGRHLWTQSSRFQPAGAAGHAFFVAYGEDTIGALPTGQAKTPSELEAERRIDLAAVVGAENVRYYSIDSGTSFAAANLSRTVCLIHQSISTLRALSDSTTPVGPGFAIAPFIRAYIDSGFDRTHPAYVNRLADSRRHFGPQTIELRPAEKQQFWDLFAGNAIDIKIRYTPDSVLKFLRLGAHPLPGTDADSAGAGFVSWNTVVTSLTSLRMTDLVDVFAEPGESRIETWRGSLSKAGNPLVFSPSEVASFNQYCQNYDLVLPFPLSGPSR